MSGLRKPTVRLALWMLLLLGGFGLFASSGLAANEAKPNVEGSVPAFVEHRFKDKRNDNVDFDIAYPTFGIPYLDEIIQGSVLNFLDGVKPEDLRLPPEEYGSWSRLYGYSLYAPKKGIVSLELGTWYYDQGMPHGYSMTWVGTGTYDLSRRKQLTLGDVFPSRSLALGKLPELFKKALKDAGSQPDGCAEIVPVLGLNFNDLGETGFLLTPDGMTLVFTNLPPHLWECALIGIDKDDLQQAGADMSLWEK